MSMPSFILLLLLSVFVIVLSSMILAYVGGIADKGSAEMRAYKVALRKWLIALASILLILAVGTLGFGIYDYVNP